MYDMTLDDINSKGLNNQAYKEFLLLKDSPVDTAIEHIEQYINNLRYPNGRKIRSERRLSMVQVISVLYGYLVTGKTSECSPSMRTIACAINHDLQKISDDDTPEEIIRKEKEIAPTLMLVQRSIKALAKFGLIKIHTYRADTNRNDDLENPNWNNPNFYYEIVPVSFICSAFRKLINKCKATLKKITNVFRCVKNFIDGQEDKRYEREHIARYNNRISFGSCVYKRE